MVLAVEHSEILRTAGAAAAAEVLETKADLVVMEEDACTGLPRMKSFCRRRLHG